MKTNELRIGNYLGWEFNDLIFTVEHLGYDCIGAYNRDGYFWKYREDLKPIPLTEEWLIKLGFVKGGAGYFIKEFDKDMKFNFKPEPTKVSINCWYFIDHLEVKYVHQLQNLFFILSGGKELEIA